MSDMPKHRTGTGKISTAKKKTGGTGKYKGKKPPSAGKFQAKKRG